MELAPRFLMELAHRLDEDKFKDILAGNAEEIAERLADCTLAGEPIDFDDEDCVLVAAYYLGKRNDI